MAASMMIVSRPLKPWLSSHFQRFTSPKFTAFLSTSRHLPQQCNVSMKSARLASVELWRSWCVTGTLVSLCAHSYRRSYVTGFTTHNCWKCNIVLNNTTEQYFCRCGVIQPTSFDRTLFEVMDIESSFDIDTKKLSNQFKKLQSLLHPDKFSQSSKVEKEYSEEQSALVNHAYSTLMKPLSRGMYLLELYGDPIDEDEIQVESDFLFTIMEINEELNETSSAERLNVIATTNRDMIDSLVASLSQAFKQKNVSEAKVILTKLKYYYNIEDKVKQKLNILSGIA